MKREEFWKDKWKKREKRCNDDTCSKTNKLKNV